VSFFGAEETIEQIETINKKTPLRGFIQRFELNY